jgi:hypothetical protein
MPGKNFVDKNLRGAVVFSRRRRKNKVFQLFKILSRLAQLITNRREILTVGATYGIKCTDFQADF